MQVSTSLSATGLGDILNLLSQDGPIDLACGAGQSTFNLISGVINEQSVWTSAKRSSSEHARRQVFFGQKRKKSSLFTQHASKLPFQDASVDLLTCAMASVALARPKYRLSRD